MTTDHIMYMEPVFLREWIEHVLLKPFLHLVMHTNHLDIPIEYSYRIVLKYLSQSFSSI